jgi:sulfur carrier protein
MKVRVNDEEIEVAEGATLIDLLGRLGLDGKRVAVERNLKIVPRAQHAGTVLRDGDRLEIVTLVGGG